MPSNFDSMKDAIEAFARGEFLIILDAANRENEGDLIIAACDLSPEKAAFMIRHTSGFLCAPISAQRAADLELPSMVTHNEDPRGTAYTVSVDACLANATGISASDRSRTCRLLANPTATAAQFHRPGHVIPLIARVGGVRARPGHTEAAIEFCVLAGKERVAVLAELAEEYPGIRMMTREQCLAFAERYGICCITIEDLLLFLEAKEDSVPFDHSSLSKTPPADRTL